MHPRTLSTQTLHPYVGLDVPHLLERRAAAAPRAPFLLFRPGGAADRDWSYKEFSNAAQGVAGGLAEHGIQRGDSVLIHLENSPEFLITWFACARLGALAVTTNTRSSPQELAYFAQRSNARLAITQPNLGSTVREAIPDIAVIETGPAFEELERSRPVELRSPDPILPLSVQFTSGTTARPKGVVWTHANALWGGQLSSTHETLRADDRHLVMMPLFHTNALAYAVLAALWAGASCVLLPRFSPSRFWDVSVAEGCTIASVPPFLLRALADRPVPPGHTFRLWGSAATDPGYAAHLGVPIMGWWGMTETITHPIVASPYDRGRPGAIGRPSPSYEIRVVDESGDQVAPGQTGHLRLRGVRGLSLFAGYLDDCEATAEAFDSEGFFKTGDMVRLDEEGTITFGDRAKDMLRVGGENVAASEIERVIVTVEGVREAAVVGAADALLDEVPVAFVVAPNSDDVASRVLAECARSLADFKVPKWVQIVTELPRHMVNKVDKKVLRHMAQDLTVSPPGSGSAHERERAR